MIPSKTKKIMDLCIGHDRWWSSSNPVLNWKVHYLLPTDIDKSLHDVPLEKIRQRMEYRADYNIRPIINQELRLHNITRT
jgi:hypothetical protein